MVSLWEVAGVFVVISLTSAVIKGAKWYWLYKLAKRAFGEVKLPKIDLGGVQNGDKGQ